MISNKFLFGTVSVLLYFFISSNLFAQLKGYSNQADYIIITPFQFTNTLQPFVSWRQKKDLNVRLVELQQIYSEFPDSNRSSSIRDFISYSLTNWSNPKPKYILLVGGAKLLPSYKVASIFASDTSLHEDSVSIDEWYSINLYESNTLPDVELGRFPVNNEQELKNIISKTIYFEDSLSFEDYPNDFVILTDKKDSSLFEYAANEFINTNIPLGFTIDTIFTSHDSTIELTREHLLNVLNNGTLFLSYYGHGAPDSWSKYNIFTFADIDSLKKNNLPFILTSASCSQPFDLPNDSSIVKKMIILKGYGTVASINTTGINLIDPGSEFLTNFYNILFSKPNITIGDALLQTKLDLEPFGYFSNDISRRYTLLGDPALKLPVNSITQVAGRTKGIPDSYILYQNFPNPFNPSTTIRYSIPKTGHVSIKVYDVLGREVAILVNEMEQSGEYEVHFNGINLSSGIYYYQMKSGDFVEVKKFVLVK